MTAIQVKAGISESAYGNCVLTLYIWGMENTKKVATVRKDDAGTAKQDESSIEAINEANREGCRFPLREDYIQRAGCLTHPDNSEYLDKFLKVMEIEEKINEMIKEASENYGCAIGVKANGYNVILSPIIHMSVPSGVANTNNRVIFVG